MNIKELLYATLTLLPILAFGQTEEKGILPADEITVVRAFEPEVELVSKVNFPPNLPRITTTVQPVAQSYQFTEHQVQLTYTPEDLRPMRYSPEIITNDDFGYLKVGMGNYFTPVMSLGLTNKNQDKFRAGLNADFIYSKSKKPLFKQYYELGVEGFGEYYFDNITVGAKLGMDLDRYHLYGMDESEAVDLNKDDVARKYVVPKFDLYFYNHNTNRWGLNFSGNFGVEVTQTNFDNKATNVSFGLHSFKEFLDETFKAGIEVEGEFSNNTTAVNKQSVSGVAIRPYGGIKKGIWSLELGPVFMVNNGDVHVLPSIQNRVKIVGDQLVMYNEWNSSIGFNNLVSVYQVNPYLANNLRFSNYRFQERIFIGLRGAIAQGFSYDVKFAQNVWNDAPLFINDTSDFKQFVQVFDERISAWNGHVEFGYSKQSEYGAKAAFDYFSYQTKTQAEAWHMPKYKFTLSGHYIWDNKLIVGLDLLTLGGIQGRGITGVSQKIKPQVDVNVNANYQINDFIGVFIELNNLINNKQPRWLQYERYGFHGIGGVKVNF